MPSADADSWRGYFLYWYKNGNPYTEGISDDAKYRTYIRNITMNKGLLQSTAKDGEKQSVYETYYNYEEPVKKAAGHRILA